MKDAKTVVITGATSGIGLATAREFAGKGWNVVLAARREDELKKVAEELTRGGVSVHTHALDTADEGAMQALATTAREMFGVIDVWVNNAGVYLAGRFEDTPLADAHRLFETNFFGYVNGSRAALTHFRDQEFGTLINVASVNSVAPMPNFSIYSASKAAVKSLDESIRMELLLDDLKNIHVCTVMPAGIDTNLYHNSANYTGKELFAIEPVYSPALVATKIAALVDKPKNEVIVGGAGRLLALQQRLSPHMYEKTVARYTQRDALGQKKSAKTPGNLFEPIGIHQGTEGGWQDRRIKGEMVDKAATLGILGLASVAALTILLFVTQKGNDDSSAKR